MVYNKNLQAGNNRVLRMKEKENENGYRYYAQGYGFG